jgi:hypothetical protein
MSLILLLGTIEQTRKKQYAINSFGEQHRDEIACALGIEDKQLRMLDLVSGVQQIQSLLQRLCIGNSFVKIQSLQNKLVDDKMVDIRLLNSLASSVKSIQAISQLIATGDIVSIQKLLIEVAEKDYVIYQQKIFQSLQDLATTSVPTVTYDILLDGISIKNKVTNVSVSCGEDSIHNSVTIQSISKDLFLDCDPVTIEGTSRIEVQVGNRNIYFLLEKRSGNELAFSLWGRSLSALEDSPYAVDLDYSLDEPKSAKSVIEEILTASSLNWDCDDWSLPTSFEFEGPPIEGVTQIAAAVGAVVRCEDDGTICVRQRFPVRPVNMNGSSVAVNYDRKSLIRLDYTYIKGTYYNAIDIVGCVNDVDLPDLYIEESSPTVGDDVHIRSYWAGKKPSGAIETYVTDGSIVSLGEETTEETESEKITFIDGVASVSRPITSITNIAWIGDSGGSISYEQYSKDLEIDDGAYRVAEVHYTTTYSRYQLTDHEVEMLLMLLTFGGESNVAVTVKIGVGDKPAPEISSPLLTTENIAIVAGTAWLDANKYNYKQVMLEAPYDDDIIDGVLCYVNDAEIDCTGNFHIKSYNIIIDGLKVINELEVIQCQV